MRNYCKLPIKENLNFNILKHNAYIAKARGICMLYRRYQILNIPLMINRYKITFASILLCCFTAAGLSSCKTKNKETGSAARPVSEKKKTAAGPGPSALPAKRPPVINIADTVAAKQTILYVKDSTITSDRISGKLAAIYIRLSKLTVENKIKVIGAPIAWYKAQKSPFFFEAGFPVDKAPKKLPKGTFIKNIGGDSAVVAHFFGPYELTPIAYEALNDYFKSHKKKKTLPPYEVYVGDPFDKNGKKIDAYKIQTDIIFPYK